ncbi:YchJ family protein [Derxia gummosa]|uniref:UPF0225 protein n=1 Tax=Derxia gummosa DSM 723 TaxID=1121388 RepID=A0A8B6X4F9_9BURK|nr:YchJ family metal-binding protein [Derxia gummosa]
MSPVDCPCGGGTFARCCGRFLDGGEQPATPEQLMRSRYSAYVLGRAGWLTETWHASTRPASLDLDEGTRWLGLTVKGAGLTSPEWGWVEFIARWRAAGPGQGAGRAHRLHERSRFVKDGGRWFYVDGDLFENG